ncbi:flagellar basal body L-ring protein FlgH [Rhodobacteraceae bacterium]|nr:flagellar basal body L-ring protein FlgH [Paracoccaceae bacterium]
MKPFFLFVLILAACAPIEHIGQPPKFSEPAQNIETHAMQYATVNSAQRSPYNSPSLWRAHRQSLLGDRRAMGIGDILTVLIEIDDKAEISNSSSRQRNAAENMGVPDLFGIPQRNAAKLPDGASFDSMIGITSNTKSSGDGSVKRKEKLTLKVAATVVSVMPNGVLAIEGSQEVRVNHELRELLVSGFVRPADISRQNSITYDKIASARVSYGGRGDISDVQQPRYGYQILDVISPF